LFLHFEYDPWGKKFMTLFYVGVTCHPGNASSYAELQFATLMISTEALSVIIDQSNI